MSEVARVFLNHLEVEGRSANDLLEYHPTWNDVFAGRGMRTASALII